MTLLLQIQGFTGAVQGRRHGVDWVGHVHPTFLKSVFIPKQKLCKKL